MRDERDETAGGAEGTTSSLESARAASRRGEAGEGKADVQVAGGRPEHAERARALGLALGPRREGLADPLAEPERVVAAAVVRVAPAALVLAALALAAVLAEQLGERVVRGSK